jgi:hypothetical protein
MKDAKEAEMQLLSLMSEELKPLKGDTHFTTPTIPKGIDDELKSNYPCDFEHSQRPRNKETPEDQPEIPIASQNHSIEESRVLRDEEDLPIILLSPFCGITKEIMSRGPQVADMECREIT